MTHEKNWPCRYRGCGKMLGTSGARHKHETRHKCQGDERLPAEQVPPDPPRWYCRLDPCPACGVRQAKHWKCVRCRCRGHAIPRWSETLRVCTWCAEEVLAKLKADERAKEVA